ncbi:DUF6159 family protein [Salinarchaeum laminariae]|uniref:DUF6159 family protein n=1 Tax=Salinarchaeum laminariae TaxID=869888 RepID=UPI0020C0F513|nr:DUF6159 family protein [Salinarchaeum laminariae]
MGFFGRLTTGWNLAKDSMHVLREEPSLAIFPLLSGIFGLVFMAALFGGTYATMGLEQGPVAYAVLFVLYFGSTFIAAFFNAALVHNAREVFHGRDPTLEEGMRAAWSHRRALAIWALVAATVGMILRAIESSDNPLANVAAMLFSVAWSILTYFIVPVIVFEDVGPTEMFKRSGETFKSTWGETAGAGFGVGIVTALFALVGFAIALAIFFVLGTGTIGLVGGVVVGAIVLLGAYLFGSALGYIARTALYVYATEGEQPEAFNNVDFGRTH